MKTAKLKTNRGDDVRIVDDGKFIYYREHDILRLVKDTARQVRYTTYEILNDNYIAFGGMINLLFGQSEITNELLQKSIENKNWERI